MLCLLRKTPPLDYARNHRKQAFGGTFLLALDRTRIESGTLAIYSLKTLSSMYVDIPWYRLINYIVTMHVKTLVAFWDGLFSIKFLNGKTTSDDYITNQSSVIKFFTLWIKFNHLGGNGQLEILSLRPVLQNRAL